MDAWKPRTVLEADMIHINRRSNGKVFLLTIGQLRREIYLEDTREANATSVFPTLPAQFDARGRGRTYRRR